MWVCDGLAYGADARAALITRGLAEMTRLGKALQAHTETFLGLAGVGDLVLTCTDNQSRNRRLGLALAAGKTVEQAQHDIGQVVEGVGNAQVVFQLAERLQVDMPITTQVMQLLQGKSTAAEAAQLLMSRPAKSEFG